jgi:hypothetical protein
MPSISGHLKYLMMLMAINDDDKDDKIMIFHCDMVNDFLIKMVI